MIVLCLTLLLAVGLLGLNRLKEAFTYECLMDTGVTTPRPLEHNTPTIERVFQNVLEATLGDEFATLVAEPSRLLFS